jgi:signal transduction histidine kinase
MTDSYKPHRPTAKRLLNQIGSRYALSNQVLVFFLVPAYGTAFVFEYLRLDTTFLERLLVATAGYIASVIPLVIARYLIFRKSDRSRPFLVLGVFLLAGFLRGTTNLALDVYTGQFTAGEELFRLLGGPIFTFVSLTVAAVLASNYQRHRAALSALADERYRLQIRSAGIRAKVQVQREELLGKVSNILNPAIAKIQASLSGKPSSEAIQSLQSTVEDVVRPLSVEVAQASDDLEAESGKAVIREKAPLPKRIMLGEFLVPLWAGLISSIGIVASAFLIEDLLNALLIIASVFFSLLFGLGLIQKITFKIPVHPVLAAVLVPALNALAATPIYLIASWLQWDVSTEQIHALMSFILVIGATTFAAQFSQLQRKSTTEKLAGVNQQLEILNASLRQELWLNRRRTAAVLHGPVQAALYAAAMKLAQDSAPTPKLIEEVSVDIEQALDKLNNPSNLEGEQISDVLEQIVEVWSDAAKITISLPADLEKDISGKPLASEALIEVSREFINNAIKHGRAKNITLGFKRIDGNRFAVEVIDDGIGVPPGAQPGFGSKLLSELALDWNQSRVDNRTHSYAEVVLGQDSA